MEKNDSLSEGEISENQIKAKEKPTSLSLSEKIDNFFNGIKECSLDDILIKEKIVNLIESNDYLKCSVYYDYEMWMQYIKIGKLKKEQLIDLANKMKEKSLDIERLEEATKKAEKFRENFEIKPELFLDDRGKELIEKDEREIKRILDNNNIDLKLCFSEDKSNEREKEKLRNFCYEENEHSQFDEDRLDYEFAMKGSLREREKIKMVVIRNRMNKDRANVLEAILCRHTESSDWMGETAMSHLASRFDDVKNGVDFYVELSDMYGQVLAYAIDVTFASSFIKKIWRIRHEIEKGQLAKIDYYLSEENDLIGRKSNVPRFVLAIDYEKMEELTELWLNDDVKNLANNNIKEMIIESMSFQSEIILRYLREKADANGLDEKNRKITKAYQKVKDFLNQLKKDSPSNRNHEIHQKMKNIFRQISKVFNN
jgi:hypothetical protein